MEAYRKQQRKKEVKKNATARIKARDEKVAATRSVEEVKSEISKLERKRDRKDEKAGLNALETKKLERLNKELRIVLGESEKRRALAEQARIEHEKELLAAQKSVTGVQKINESKYSLLERYASVYYDETMNPFGAPAPGQPKLFYADAAGTATTMDPRRAVVPEKWRSKFDAEGGGKKEEYVARKRHWDDSGGRGNVTTAENNQQQMNMMMEHLPPTTTPSNHPCLCCRCSSCSNLLSNVLASQSTNREGKIIISLAIFHSFRSGTTRS